MSALYCYDGRPEATNLERERVILAHGSGDSRVRPGAGEHSVSCQGHVTKQRVSHKPGRRKRGKEGGGSERGREEETMSYNYR